MSGVDMLNMVAQLKHYCAAFRVDRNDDGEEYFRQPLVLIDVINGLKPALVLFDGRRIEIVCASQVTADPDDYDHSYYLATEKVLAAMLDNISYE